MQIPLCLPLKSMFKYSLLAENLKVQLPHLYCTFVWQEKVISLNELFLIHYGIFHAEL